MSYVYWMRSIDLHQEWVRGLKTKNALIFVDFHIPLGIRTNEPCIMIVFWSYLGVQEFLESCEELKRSGLVEIALWHYWVFNTINGGQEKQLWGMKWNRNFTFALFRIWNKTKQKIELGCLSWKVSVIFFSHLCN